MNDNSSAITAVDRASSLSLFFFPFKGHLKEIPFPYPLLPVKGIEEKPVPYAEIRVACARHRRETRETSIYHVFINMNPK